MAAEPKTYSHGHDDLHLPTEIRTEIINKLPVKSILRFRSVSKSWYSLISSPNFISEYSKTLNKNGKRVLLGLYKDKRVLSFIPHVDESFMESREHDIPEAFLGDPDPSLGDCLQIIGSCNGLVCLYKVSNDVNYSSCSDFLVWNPTIRKVVELPSRTYCARTHIPSFLGFGLDSDINDYKVLFSLRRWNGAFPDHMPGHVCEIYGLKEGVWRDISPKLPSWSDLHFRQGCYLNGAVHWIGYMHFHRCYMSLLSFSMADECFRKIKMSDHEEFTLVRDNHDYYHYYHGHDGDYYITRTVTCGGLIYVITWKGRDGHIDMSHSQSFSIWAMREYGVTESWTKLSSINMQSALVLPNTELVTQKHLLWENDEVLLTLDHSFSDDEGLKYKQYLILYNTRSRESKRVFSTAEIILDLYLYEESLVLM